MLVINEVNLPLLTKVTSIQEILRLNALVKLDLPYASVLRLVDNGMPVYKILRSWIGCDNRYVDDIGVDNLTYNELEAVTLNPTISRLALEHHRFEQVLPKPIFSEAMAGLDYQACEDYRLDIVDTLKVPTILPVDKVKLIDDALKVNLLPARSIDELEDISAPVLSLALTSNLMKIKHDKVLVVPELITKDVVRTQATYNGLLMLLMAGKYDVVTLDKLFQLCDIYQKYDYIRNLPNIPTYVKTKSWFEVCETSSSAIKYVATNGTFNKSTLDTFIDLIERKGCMADMILLYENRRLTEDQKAHIKVCTEPTINVVDYRPALFDSYITDGTTYDIENFATTYKEFPSAMLLLQSPAALALTGIYYMYHLHDNVDFLLEYLLRTTEVTFTDSSLSKLLSVVIKSECDDAYILFLLSEAVTLDYKEQLIKEII